VADFLSTHYDLPNPIECRLLYRGWNDVFEVLSNGKTRFIFRISKRRRRGDADVESETAFLAYLDAADVPVAAAIPTRNGSLFTSMSFPEGWRPAVLFRHAEGRPSQARSSLADARANGVTLAQIHEAAGRFDGRDRGRYRLDANHLLHRPLSAILEIDDLSGSVRTGLVDLTERLCRAWEERDGLSRTRCHGDCHGYNAHIALQGPRSGQAVFFDFDESGAGYLAYDLAVFLWNCVLFERKDHASWHAFIEGYLTISELSHADLEAVHLFVPVRHMWLLGEYASRIHELGRQAVPADWIGAQLDFMLAWEQERLAPGLLLPAAGLAD
jgi:Ser/Thr protein kinase RdoA (MazF antagonist)